jgi:hypothetical protein
VAANNRLRVPSPPSRLAPASRRLVGVLALALGCSLIVGVTLTYRIPSLKSRRHDVGIASASVLVDSSRSQLADLGATSGTDLNTLATRASLLASMMASSQFKNDIASRAGVLSRDLVVIPPAQVQPATTAAPAVTASSPSSPQVSVVNVSIPNLQAGLIPLILVGTQASTASKAALLANASVAALEAEVSSVAAADHVPPLQQLTIRALGRAASSTVSRGPGTLEGLLAGLATFLVICAAGLTGTIRSLVGGLAGEKPPSADGREHRASREHIELERRELPEHGNVRRDYVPATANGTLEPVPATANATREPVRESADGTREPVRESADGTLEPVRESANGTREPVPATANATREPVPATTSGTFEPVPESADGTLEPVPESADGTFEPVPESANGTFEPVPESADGTFEPVPESANGTFEPVPAIANGTLETQLSVARRMLVQHEARYRSPADA